MEQILVNSPKTGRLESYQTPPLIPNYTASLDRYAAAPNPPWRLRLQISGEKHTTIGMEVTARIVLGRFDPDIQPDLDLNDYGGLMWGVSRQHAQIVQEEQSLYIEDLNSTNHTCLNGFTLIPFTRYRLRDGDELRLGKLKIMVRFVNAPLQN